MLLGLLVAGCPKPIPSTGPVAYPPSWPLPSLTAPAGATKAKVHRHLDYEDAGGLHDPYFVEAATTGDPGEGVQYLVRFYYAGTARELFDHVESGLSAEGYSQGGSQNKYAGRGEYGTATYEVLRKRERVMLIVEYHGHADPPSVGYLIYVYERP